MFKLVSGALVALFFCVPAFAQSCLSPEALLANPSEAVPVDDLKVTGALFDREIIVHYKGYEFIWLFKDGCAVSKPLLMGADPSAPDATPSSTPQQVPAYTGPSA